MSSAAAVLGFNWIAAALCHILCRAFCLGATNFFDDFHVLEEDDLCEHTDQLITDLFGLLGWDLKKMPEFSLNPEPLGARFDLGGLPDGIFTVGNRSAPTASGRSVARASDRSGCALCPISL